MGRPRGVLQGVHIGSTPGVVGAGTLYSAKDYPAPSYPFSTVTKYSTLSADQQTSEHQNI